MAPHHSDSSEVENGNPGATALLAEIEALRQRLAALEARLPENACAEPSERRPAKARTSTKTVVGLTTGAVLAILAGGAIAYGADALIIGPDGATIFAKSINFDTRLGALLTLYDPEYTIGIQPNTFYQRSYKHFAWYKGGGHSDGELDPGGGSKMMLLSDGNLDVAGSVKAKSFDVDGSGTVTAGSVTTGTLTVNDKDKGLTVSGPIKIDGKNVLAFGVGNNKNDGNSGTIGYQVHTPDALDIVGAGDGGKPRKIKFWAEGGATLAGSLDVSGVVDGNMKVVYQRDDDAQTTYQKPL